MFGGEGDIFTATFVVGTAFGAGSGCHPHAQPHAASADEMGCDAVLACGNSELYEPGKDQTTAHFAVPGLDGAGIGPVFESATCWRVAWMGVCDGA